MTAFIIGFARVALMLEYTTSLGLISLWREPTNIVVNEDRLKNLVFRKKFMWALGTSSVRDFLRIGNPTRKPENRISKMVKNHSDRLS